ncbi:MAG: chemotaxis protein CheD [Wenzhouxiangella sp.]
MTKGWTAECLTVGETSDFVDAVTGEAATRILLGGGCISRVPRRLLTLLGSCVAVCLYDPVSGVGGMNHFMLPRRGSRVPLPDDVRFGNDALPWLVHGAVELGADRRRLRAKLFGGAGAMGPNNRVGADNIEFARDFLATERIEIVAEEVGKRVSRQVRFETRTGRAFVRYVDSGDGQALIGREQAAMERARAALPEA